MAYSSRFQEEHPLHDTSQPNNSAGTYNSFWNVHPEQLHHLLLVTAILPMWISSISILKTKNKDCILNYTTGRDNISFVINANSRNAAWIQCYTLYKILHDYTFFSMQISASLQQRLSSRLLLIDGFLHMSRCPGASPRLKKLQSSFLKHGCVIRNDGYVVITV